MALGEAKRVVTGAKGGNKITEVSWTGGTAQDVYYGLDHSFQYSANINTDDEMHGIKLATRAVHTNSYAKCQLVSLGEHGVMAVPITSQPGDEIYLKRFQFNGYYEQNKWTEFDDQAGTLYATAYKGVPGVVFQNRLWYGGNLTGQNNGYLFSVPLAVGGSGHGVDQEHKYLPCDHNDYTDESIEDPNDIVLGGEMKGRITAILNYNNTRLVVACGDEVWVYYPELDSNRSGNIYGTTGWKKVLSYEAGVTIVALTCTFEYLKVRAVDEGWNTKVYYYQGNNNLRSTFVYNVVDLTGVRVLHVYPINGIDYYTSSIGQYASDSLIDFNKMVGATPIKLFSQRAGMTRYDVNNKAPYFVGPTSISGAYNNGNIYVADAYGVFSFRYTPNGYDKGYMKWKLRDRIVEGNQVYGLCENKGILYVSDSTGCWAMRLYDTGYDGYQPKGILISREFEGAEGGTITKMLDEIRLNFELNPLTTGNGEIAVYVSPNNRWKDTDPSGDGDEDDYWYQVMTITQSSAGTRTEKSNLLNQLGPDGKPAFAFDWQTITYAIVIYRGDEEQATPIVRQIDIRYHCKDKVNNVYDIN